MYNGIGFPLTDDEIEELSRLFEIETNKQKAHKSTYDCGDFGFYDLDIPDVICNHDWRRDVFFSKTVYETCKKCGVKKEEL
jgi:hypothetical protein